MKKVGAEPARRVIIDPPTPFAPQERWASFRKELEAGPLDDPGVIAATKEADAILKLHRRFKGDRTKVASAWVRQQPKSSPKRIQAAMRRLIATKSTK